MKYSRVRRATMPDLAMIVNVVDVSIFTDLHDLSN